MKKYRTKKSQSLKDRSLKETLPREDLTMDNLMKVEKGGRGLLELDLGVLFKSI